MTQSDESNNQGPEAPTTAEAAAGTNAPGGEARGAHNFTIKIDRIEYHVEANQLSGLQLRSLPHPPIGPDRDLFEVVPGGSDVKIADDAIVVMRDGLRFFTAPAQINPGDRAWNSCCHQSITNC